jgi:RNA polymerase sigma-70 factor (ECF subfamily)
MIDVMELRLTLPQRMNTGRHERISLPTPELQALIVRCQVGDKDALGEFYRCYRQEVTRNLYRVLGPHRSDLEDVLQDVFIEVFRSIGRFRGDSQLSTWLYRICINVALQRLRKRKRWNEVPELERPTALPGQVNEQTPERGLDARRRLDVVYRLLDELAPKKRVVFVLHEIEGLEPKEIAAIVGAPVLTVRTRLHYARKEFYASAAAEPHLDGQKTDGAT